MNEYTMGSVTLNPAPNAAAPAGPPTGTLTSVTLGECRVCRESASGYCVLHNPAHTNPMAGDNELSRLRQENERLQKVNNGLLQENTSQVAAIGRMQSELAISWTDLPGAIDALDDAVPAGLRPLLRQCAKELRELRRPVVQDAARYRNAHDVLMAERVNFQERIDELQHLHAKRDAADRAAGVRLHAHVQATEQLHARIEQLKAAISLLRDALDLYDTHCDWDDDHPAKSSAREALASVELVCGKRTDDGETGNG